MGPLAGSHSRTQTPGRRRGAGEQLELASASAAAPRPFTLTPQSRLMSDPQLPSLEPSSSLRVVALSPGLSLSISDAGEREGLREVARELGPRAGLFDVVEGLMEAGLVEHRHMSLLFRLANDGDPRLVAGAPSPLTLVLPEPARQASTLSTRLALREPFSRVVLRARPADTGRGMRSCVRCEMPRCDHHHHHPHHPHPHPHHLHHHHHHPIIINHQHHARS
eukprot:2025847-Rhodomonas_salina.7